MLTNHPQDYDVFEIVDEHPVDPGAGNPCIFTFSPNCRTELIAVKFRAVTSIDVGDRYFNIAFMDGGTPKLRFFANAAQPASKDWEYNFVQASYQEPGLNALPNRVAGALGIGIILNSEPGFQIDADGLLAADQISSVYVWYKRWVRGTIAP